MLQVSPETPLGAARDTLVYLKPGAKGNFYHNFKVFCRITVTTYINPYEGWIENTSGGMVVVNRNRRSKDQEYLVQFLDA